MSTLWVVPPPPEFPDDLEIRVFREAVGELAAKLRRDAALLSRVARGGGKLKGWEKRHVVCLLRRQAAFGRVTLLADLEKVNL